MQGVLGVQPRTLYFAIKGLKVTKNHRTFFSEVHDCSLTLNQTPIDPGLNIEHLGEQLTMILDLNPPILDDEL